MGEDSEYAKVVELDILEEGKAIRAELGSMIGRTSVPAIWINGIFIGGCNDGGEKGGLLTMDKSGELDVLLREVGILA